MGQYLGNYADNAPVGFSWGTSTGAGGSATRATDGTVLVVKKGALSGSGATVSKANPGVVSDTAHGLENGDEVFFHGMIEMTELNRAVHTVANKTADTFEIADTSSYGSAETTGGSWVQVNTADVIDSEDLLTVKGVHEALINTAADDYFTTGAEYYVILVGAQVGGQTVNAPLGHFSIQNRSVEITGSGALAGSDATVTATGIVTAGASGALTGTDATVEATGTVELGVSDGNLTGSAAATSAAGAVVVAGSGALAGTDATTAAAGAVAIDGTGTLAGTDATVTATGIVTTGAGGALAGTDATVTADGTVEVGVTDGNLVGAPAATDATGEVLVVGSGTLIGSAATGAGAGTVLVSGGGALVGTPATTSGSGSVSGGDINATGALAGSDATVTAAGTVRISAAGTLLGASAQTRWGGGIPYTPSSRGTVLVSSTGADLVGSDATVVASGTIGAARTASGDLVGSPATVVATGSVLVSGDGYLATAGALVIATGGVYIQARATLVGLGAVTAGWGTRSGGPVAGGGNLLGSNATASGSGSVNVTGSGDLRGSDARTRRRRWWGTEKSTGAVTVATTSADLTGVAAVVTGDGVITGGFNAEGTLIGVPATAVGTGRVLVAIVFADLVGDGAVTAGGSVASRGLEVLCARLFNLVAADTTLGMRNVKYLPRAGPERWVRAQFDPTPGEVVLRENLEGVTRDGVLYVGYGASGIAEPNERDEFLIDGLRFNVVTVGPRSGGCRRIELHRIEVSTRTAGPLRRQTV